MSQFELFPKNADRLNVETSRSHGQIKDLTLSVENIIVLCIILVMSFVLFFSFGVERGRHLALNNLQKEIVVQEVLPQGEVSPEGVIQVTSDVQQRPSSGALPRETAEETEIIQLPVERQLTEKDFFTIQVASFKQEESAKEEAQRLINMGQESFVVPKGSYSIVCVGKFTQKEQANQFSKKLKSKYTDLLVRRL